MRLLNATTRQLVAFAENQVPRYAILSHTWGAADEEVSFQDLQGAAPEPDAQPNPPSWTETLGWDKIKGACAQSLAYDCEYLWVDTCCIDKLSSAELQEEINSMFRWYESAEICLAYLSDVSSDCDPEASDSAFRKARWFTRGWTLQELLAPVVVLFFDRDWNVLGTKESLSGVLEDFTGIGSRYISWADRCHSISERDAYGSLSQASVAERMSWAARRQTTRKEDMAYCLLGLFDIHMPMLYGEGDRAFARLQEEIMKATDDSTLLSWGYKGSWDECQRADTILAPIPGSFKNCGDLVPSKLHGFPRPSFSTTQKGLEITLPVRADKTHNHLVYAILACGPRVSIDEPGCCKALLAVPLISTSACDDESLWNQQDEYLRYKWCSPTLVSRGFLESAQLKTIVIRRPSQNSKNLMNLSISVKKPQGYDLIGTYPPQPITQLVGTRFVSLSNSYAREPPSWIEPSSRLKTMILLNRDGHKLKWHSEEGQRMFQIATLNGNFLVILKYKVAIARDISGESKEWSQCTGCRIFEMPSMEFQLELCYDLGLSQDFNQLREVQAADSREEDTVFRIRNQGELAIVVRIQSLDDFLRRTTTSIGILIGEGHTNSKVGS